MIVDMVKKTIEEGKKTWGYDAEREEFGDMIEKGIIDPLKVVRAGLENAASVACMVLTTESCITEIPEKEKEKMPPMPEY